MFRTIVLALLAVEIWLPLICGIVEYLLDEDNSIWCRIFAVVIVLLIIILV